MLAISVICFKIGVINAISVCFLGIMKHLFSVWAKVAPRLNRAKHVLLLLDYDGTLTPIVSRPELAILDNKMRNLLISLQDSGRFSIGIISGRRLTEVKKLVRVKGIYYGGNHGLEIEGPDIKFLHPSLSRFRPSLKQIKEALREKVKVVRGALLEDKGLTLSLHYRLVAGKEVEKLKSAFNKICAPYVKKGRAKVTAGKKVLELRPPIAWNKGKAVKAIGRIAKKPGRNLIIYLGDNRTDEDAFRVLKGKGVSIYVGRPKASGQAAFFLRDTQEVGEFLSRLVKLR